MQHVVCLDHESYHQTSITLGQVDTSRVKVGSLMEGTNYNGSCQDHRGLPKTRSVSIKPSKGLKSSCPSICRESHIQGLGCVNDLAREV